MKTDLFCPNCLPVELTDQARGRLGNFSEKFLLATILANLIDQREKPLKATASFETVGDTVTLLSDDFAAGQIVEVFNNGASDVLLLTGGDPSFDDGITPDIGLRMGSGGYWKSDRLISSSVRAIAPPGQSTSITVITYRK